MYRSLRRFTGNANLSDNITGSQSYNACIYSIMKDDDQTSLKMTRKLNCHKYVAEVKYRVNVESLT